MAACSTRSACVVVDVVQQSCADRCLQRRSPMVDEAIRQGGVNDVPGAGRSVSHLDTSADAVALGSNPPIDGADRRRALANRQMASAWRRWIAKRRATHS